MRIAICEDEPRQMELLIAMINRWADKSGIKAVICSFHSAEEFLFHWQDNAHYDLAFMDIQLATMSGMELAQYIRRQDRTMLLVFTTGLKDYLLKGYEVQAYRYLIKPLKQEDIYKTLTKANAEISLARADAMIIPNGSGSIRIFKNDIYYFEIDNHYVVAHTARGNFRYKEKLSNLEAILLEPHFCKCHRSYLINLHHTGQLTRETVEIDNGDKLPVSRSRWTALNECFINYYTQQVHDEVALNEPHD